MKLKSLVVAAAVSAVSSIAANAAVVSLGALPTGTTDFNNGAFVVLSDPLLGGTFLDALVFGLPANSGSSYGVIEVPLDLSAVVPGLKFSTLFSFVSVMGPGPDGTLFTGGDDVLLAGGFVTPNAPKFSFSMGPSPGGAFYLLVGGVTPIGSVGSLYSGSISVATAVPEPESYAMLLAGLGVMGAIAIRRNKSKSD